MATPPSEVRSALQVVAAAAAAEVVEVAKSTEPDPSTLRAALFATAPLIVSDYTAGSGALALDWYQDLRDEFGIRDSFSPVLLELVTDDEVRAVVAETTRALHEIEQGFQRDLDASVSESVQLLSESVEKQVIDGFTETIVTNSKRDPVAAGWRRFARPEACSFCKMLAARGAVYTQKTVRFAAHGAVMSGNRKGGNCMCIAGPSFATEGLVEASAMQYVASQKQRTPEQKTALKQYLHENFGGPQPRETRDDAPRAVRQEGGFMNMTRAQVELQIRITEELKPSKWRDRQLDRLRRRLRRL